MPGMPVWFCLALAVALGGQAFAGNINPERIYQAAWCSAAGGRIETTLEDRTRVDCLTTEYAVEVDFARKWAEAIGQSLYYAKMTGKRPGIVLILEEDNDRRHLHRLMQIADELDIMVWTTSPGEIQ